MSDTVVRKMTSSDLDSAAAVHKAAFVRQRRSRQWMASSLAAWPKTLSFVVTANGTCLGYVLWTQKSGFRPQVVLELEQIAVHPEFQGRGLGRRMIRESLPQVVSILGAAGSTLKHLLVTTRADNQAQALYSSELGAEIEALLPELYSADEVIMVARDTRRWQSAVKVTEGGQ